VNDTVSERRPAVGYLELDPLRLLGTACEGCGAVTLEDRVSCGRCGGRSFGTRPLSTTGTVRSFTVVTRSAPGIPTPYVSVVVALDGGGHLRSGLTGVPADPDRVRIGMPVRLATAVAGRDTDGADLVVPTFEPA
jgi:uncharacterized OB-fold protein